MKKPFALVFWAAALCAAGAAQAVVLNFDNPGQIDIDPNSGVATYVESGFAFSAPAASFLPLEGALVGGIDGSTPLNFGAVGGASFSLLAFDYAFYDLGFGDPAGSLSVRGLRNGVQVASQMFTLGALSSAVFGAGFANLTSVSFNGTSGFMLDNIGVQALAPVPEPATVVLTGVGLFGVALYACRRRRVA